MEANLNLEEFEIIEIAVFYLVLTIISFAAYLITIKGMFDFFPNVMKALGAFLVDVAIGVVIAIAMYGISSATTANAPTELNPIILLALVVSIVVTVLARKVTLNYATEMDITILQAVNSIVMNYFYIAIIAVLITLILLMVYKGNIDPEFFKKYGLTEPGLIALRFS